MFTDQQRRIFSYMVGDQMVFVDPQRALILLKLATGGRLDALTKAHNVMLGYPPDGVSEGDTAFKPTPPAPDTDEYMAGQRARISIADATVMAFNLPQFDSQTGHGTTMDEAIAIYTLFTAFMHAKKNSGGM